MYYGAENLSDMIGIEVKDLHELLKMEPPSFYQYWRVPKKSGGGTRPILAPTDSLRIIQRRILKKIINPLGFPAVSHGGVPGRSIITNAKPHLNSKSMLAVDLRNAFGTPYTPPPRRLLGIESSNAYRLLQFLTLVELDGVICLPQGAPTSTALFNLSCRSMDKRIEKFAEKIGGIYTRFVDNLVFSWKEPEVAGPVRRAIIRIIVDEGFEPNQRKTVCIRNGNRPGVPLRVPGINIIEGKPRLNPKILRHLRMVLYCALMSGNKAVLHGIVGYAKMIYGEPLPNQLLRVIEKLRQPKLPFQGS